MSSLRGDVRVHPTTAGQTPLVCVANRSKERQLPKDVQVYVCQGLARKLKKHRVELEEGRPRKGKKFIRDNTFMQVKFPAKISLDDAKRIVRRAVTELIKSLNPAERQKRRQHQAVAKAERHASHQQLHQGKTGYHQQSRSFRLAYAGH